jgi:hypothetical protein
MKTDYKAVAKEVRSKMLEMRKDGNDPIGKYSKGAYDLLNFWESKMGELEEKDPSFDEGKLKAEIMSLINSTAKLLIDPKLN